MNAKDIIRASEIKFGTSGARGLVEQFTPEVCAAFTIAFISSMQQSFQFNRVSIAIDRRPSSPDIAAACAAAAEKMGVVVDYFGVLPTPALALQSMQANQPAIMITGSHIPFDRNGMKFYRPDGEINKNDELAIISSTEEINELKEFPKPLNAPLTSQQNKAEQLYLRRYTQMVPTALLQGKRVGIYQHSSAGRDLYVRLFETLGAEVIALGRSEKFVPIDTEAVREEDIAQGKQWAASEKLDFLFSTDGDGDRPLIADENGQWLRGDIVGLLTAQYLNVDAIAIPVSCNTVIEKSNAFKNVLRTKIGSPYVIEGMQQLIKTFKSVAGFEANGGFLLGSALYVNGYALKALPTRDAVLPVIALMAASIKAQKSMSQLVSQLPQRYTASNRLENFPTEKAKELLELCSQQPKRGLALLGLTNKVIEEQNSIDGLRWSFTDTTVVHIRPSGNAPELRCYTEAASEDEAKNLLNNTLELLAQG